MSRLVGIADEYGTIWAGEPGASVRIGDLVTRPDDETQEVRLAALALVLNDYELANLRAGLELLRKIGCDTGDWLGQILWKLPDVEQKPNCTVDDQLKRVRVPS